VGLCGPTQIWCDHPAGRLESGAEQSRAEQSRGEERERLPVPRRHEVESIVILSGKAKDHVHAYVLFKQL
jgi:hypothetical protein